MFEEVDKGDRIDKDSYQRYLPELRVNLINAQYELRDAGFSVIILIAGDDRIAANDLINTLNEWMDARYIRTHVFPAPSDEERERPRFWRYWRALPANGSIALFVGAWAMNPIAEQIFGDADKKEFSNRLEHIRRFEQALADDGTVLLKFWLHLPEKAHRKRARASRHDDSKELLDDTDWKIYKSLDKALPLGEKLIRATSTGSCPWQIIDSSNKQHRNITVATSILETITGRLETPRPRTRKRPGKASAECLSGPLDDVNLSARLDYDDYKSQLHQYQKKIHSRTLDARHQGQTSVLVFEGWDAAGKGGTIRRITRAMHARDYQIVPIAAPTDEELAHHYLWRFWRHLPRAGKVIIFDRSWYGRVLVERVEGFATPEEWQRAFEEINDFEALLAECGINIQKFWLHIDPDEQLRRFQAREKTDYKKYKITEEDYRNRERWDDYVCAVNDMVKRTSTPQASWHLVSANNKRWARVQILKIFAKSLKRN